MEMKATDIATQKSIISEVISELMTQIGDLNIMLESGGYDIIDSVMNKGVFIRKASELAHKEFLEAYLIHYRSIFSALCELESYRELGELSEVKARLDCASTTSDELKKLKIKLSEIAKLSEGR